ncbi:hypothetical protein GLOTRDRAFT_140571 [Gloeophyllum trabeum ATCC 11539]|uniref:Aminoglycoside phosphotransferase domain-containing protein n=1 Tax=Gloeophyllum trabeum (strain ATCC 11539 / FP-39264 / Madison 617) TaxID=670483 RepID=S7PXU2_GLOTA|nr:uncharacterized protein GLOTRDRAFT_140571 [Gloeophyllum trabeum ATCC 11539]EPQ52147.1 hypothetical protein GLOTRDRAFT_140571 [Gloeophyllum trabeum ATCC 11539]
MSEFVENGVKIHVILAKLGDHFGDPVGEIERGPRGSHHMTYIVTQESGTKRLLRVSYPVFKDFGSGIVPPSKMKSEIATIKYVREHTNIPVPEVLLHDSDEDGSVGAEWMVMEYVNSLPLSQMWFSMSEDQRQGAVQGIAGVFHQLLGLRFDKIGSLYENEEAKIHVGPMTFMPSNNTRDTAPPNPAKCGPFESIKQWLLALAAGDLNFESTNVDEPVEAERRAAVIEDITSTTIFEDESLKEFCAIVLEHVDLKVNNFLVDPEDPTKILGVIDWEGARTVPLFAIQPRWYTPLGTPPECISSEEVTKLQVSTREAVQTLSPAWYSSTEDPGRALREVLHRAIHSRLDPEMFDFESMDCWHRGA